MKKILIPVIIIIIIIAVAISLAVGNESDNETSESTDIVAEIPYINDFTCVYYDINGEKIEDKETVFEPGDEIRVKTNFTLLPDAYAEGKGRFTVKFILSADFTGKIASANSSATSDKDLTATFTADDKNPKNCEIETRINVNFSAGSFKIAYAYDDEEYTEACELPLNNNKTLSYFYDEITGECIVLKDYDNKEWIKNVDKVSIPNFFEDKPITTIDGYLFNNCVNLTSVEIPASLTSIGKSAFSGCCSLTSITIPDSVTSISSSAFYGCTSLTSVTIPDSVTYIGSGAFEGCAGLTSIIIPNSVTYIESSVFSGCSSLTNVTIPDSVTYIESNAFNGCDRLQYNEYGNAYYLGNEQNPYVVLIRSVSADITSVEINKKTKIINNDAFSGCSNLIYITMPNSVTNIGSRAFSGCSGLVSITIPNGVAVIEDGTFSGCSSLTSIEIPDSVKGIVDDAFSGCSNLEYIFFGGTKSEWVWIVGWRKSLDDVNVTINCSDGVYIY